MRLRFQGYCCKSGILPFLPIESLEITLTVPLTDTFQQVALLNYYNFKCTVQPPCTVLINKTAFIILYDRVP